MSSRLKVVLNTNVWLSAIFWPKGLGAILDFWRREQVFDIIFSDETFREWVDKVGAKARVFKKGKWVKEYQFWIREFALWVGPKEKISICRDPSDDKFLEAASAGGADYIVTGDRDLQVIGKFRKTKIVTPKRFLRILWKKKNR